MHSNANVAIKEHTQCIKRAIDLNYITKTHPVEEKTGDLPIIDFSLDTNPSKNNLFFSPFSARLSLYTRLFLGWEDTWIIPASGCNLESYHIGCFFGLIAEKKNRDLVFLSPGPAEALLTLRCDVGEDVSRLTAPSLPGAALAQYLRRKALAGTKADTSRHAFRYFCIFVGIVSWTWRKSLREKISYLKSKSDRDSALWEAK